MTIANSKLQDKLCAHEGAPFLIHTYLHTDKYLHGKLGSRGAAQTIKAPTTNLRGKKLKFQPQKKLKKCHN